VVPWNLRQPCYQLKYVASISLQNYSVTFSWENQSWLIYILIFASGNKYEQSTGTSELYFMTMEIMKNPEVIVWYLILKGMQFICEPLLIVGACLCSQMSTEDLLKLCVGWPCLALRRKYLKIDIFCKNNYFIYFSHLWLDLL
jgi:hypothetical protein